MGISKQKKIDFSEIAKMMFLALDNFNALTQKDETNGRMFENGKVRIFKSFFETYGIEINFHQRKVVDKYHATFFDCNRIFIKKFHTIVENGLSKEFVSEANIAYYSGMLETLKYLEECKNGISTK